MPIDPGRVQAVFLAAIESKDPAERVEVLNAHCAGDAELRARVEELLQAHDQSSELPGVGHGEFAPGSRATVIQSATASAGRVIAGRYRLLEEIGEGGMGTVWVAEQTQPVRRRVAIKLIKPGMDSRQVLSRFEAERQALAVMDHPNIAKVLDGGVTDEGRPYFVMEYVKGMPITEFCDHAKVTVAGRLNLFVQVCQAVQHAHQKGIIHRDLKPSNILVCLYDGQPVPKVIDFGLAKAIHQPLTEHTLYTAHGMMVGTPMYMSPEQAELNNLDIDTRTDIFSLGVILYELLTGTTPLDRQRFKEAAWQEVVRLIKEEEPSKPSTKLSGSGSLPSVAAQRSLEPAQLTRLVRGDLDWIVMKSLEKERSRRYTTPGSFAEDIERYLRHEVISARPPSRAYRLKKFAQRNRASVLAVAVVAVALVAGTAVSAWQAFRATRAETAALLAAEAERKAKVDALVAAKGERKAKDDALVAAEAERKAKDDALVAANGERKAKDHALVAAEAEKRAKEDALAREVETKAVLGFVENRIIAAARPEREPEGLGRKVTLRKAIESALPYVHESFPNQPLIEARLRLTMGRSFILLGDARMSTEQLEAARALYTRHRGADSPDTLQSMNDLATSYRALGRITDALKLSEETLAVRKTKLGPDHPDTLISMGNVANSYRAVGRHADALRLNEETLTLRKAKLGPDHRDTLKSMGDLASSYYAAGRYAEALKLYEETLALQKAKFGLSNVDTLRCMRNLALTYNALGRHPEALKLREETLALNKAKLGPDHPDTLRSMNDLAGSYYGLGRYTDTLKLIKEALALKKAKLGPDHPETLWSMDNLALTYDALGRHAEALKLHEETLALQKAKLGPDHPDTLRSMNSLAESYIGLSRYADAFKLSHETLALRKSKLGQDHPDTLESMNNLAETYYALGQHGEALKLFEETLALQKSKLGLDHPSTLLTMRGVAKSLLTVHRGAEAAAAIRPAATIWEKLNRTDSDSLYKAASFRAVTAAALRAADKSASAAHEADAEADRAMAWLKQAVSAGYKDAAHMNRDSDLDSLRAREDFKQLVAELERVKPSEKAKP
jgi:serine/threonine protein kinase/tetratricopeptide (TPR) repeat protein